MKYKCCICNKEFSQQEKCPHVKEFGIAKCLEHNIIEEVMDGKDLFKIRKKLGLTQSQLAKEIGVSCSAISRWENQERCVKNWVKKTLEAVFGKKTIKRILKEGEDDSRKDNGKQDETIQTVSSEVQ